MLSTLKTTKFVSWFQYIISSTFSLFVKAHNLYHILLILSVMKSFKRMKIWKKSKKNGFGKNLSLLEFDPATRAVLADHLKMIWNIKDSEWVTLDLFRSH
jgi:hypothetical protein